MKFANFQEYTQTTTKTSLYSDDFKDTVKEDVVADILSKPQTTTRKAKTGTRTALHLDFKDVPPQNDLAKLDLEAIDKQI